MTTEANIGGTPAGGASSTTGSTTATTPAPVPSTPATTPAAPQATGAVETPSTSSSETGKPNWNFQEYLAKHGEALANTPEPVVEEEPTEAGDPAAAAASDAPPVKPEGSDAGTQAATVEADPATTETPEAKAAAEAATAEPEVVQPQEVQALQRQLDQHRTIIEASASIFDTAFDETKDGVDLLESVEAATGRKMESIINDAIAVDPAANTQHILKTHFKVSTPIDKLVELAEAYEAGDIVLPSEVDDDRTPEQRAADAALKARERAITERETAAEKTAREAIEATQKAANEKVLTGFNEQLMQKTYSVLTDNGFVPAKEDPAPVAAAKQALVRIVLAAEMATFMEDANYRKVAGQYEGGKQKQGDMLASGYMLSHEDRVTAMAESLKPLLQGIVAERQAAAETIQGSPSLPAGSSPAITAATGQAPVTKPDAAAGTRAFSEERKAQLSARIAAQQAAQAKVNSPLYIP